MAFAPSGMEDAVDGIIFVLGLFDAAAGRAPAIAEWHSTDLEMAD